MQGEVTLASLLTSMVKLAAYVQLALVLILSCGFSITVAMHHVYVCTYVCIGWGNRESERDIYKFQHSPTISPLAHFCNSVGCAANHLGLGSLLPELYPTSSAQVASTASIDGMGNTPIGVGNYQEHASPTKFLILGF